MWNTSGNSVLLRIFSGTVFTILTLYMLISCEEKRRLKGVTENNQFCGYFIEYYERKSRSGSIFKYAKIRNNDLTEAISLTHRTSGLNNLIKNQEVCLSYYLNLFNEKTAIDIKSKSLK